VSTLANTDLVAHTSREPDLVFADPIGRLLRIASEGTTSELLFEATMDITRLLGQRGSCILLEGRPRVALAPHNPEAVNLTLDLSRYPELVAAIESDEPVTIDDVHRDARLDSVRHLLPPNLRAVSVIPLSRPGGCLGAFLVQSPHPTTISPQALSTAAMLARITALMLSERRVQGTSTTARPRPTPTSIEVGALLGTAETPRPQIRLTPHRILIVEDDPGLKATLAESIQDEGYLVTTAANGEEGLTQTLAMQPDLILLDVALPKVDGFELARQIRDTHAFRSVPIVFLSGADDLPTRVRGTGLEEIDFLRKPFSCDELFARIQRALEQGASRERLRQEAQLDELTGLGNRRCLGSRMAGERARFERYGEPLSVAVFDIDKLKQINDQRGHLAGDATIKAVADVLRREGRESDLAVRYGGDEFVVLLPHTSSEEALVFASRTLNHVGRLNLNGLTVTVSAGVASMRGRPGAESGDDIIKRADAAAYRAKRLGGNRVFRDEE
jgi:two-component system cell cycle response regulator